VPDSSAAELTTVANDEVVIHEGTSVRRLLGLPPDTQMHDGGFDLRTLPALGEHYSTVATVNDLHFGETQIPIERDPDEDPYPEFMNADAVAEILELDPALVVVKGDLTSDGTREQYERFLEVYQGAFGDRMIHIRGNHESYPLLDTEPPPTQERVLDGVTIALLDTSRPGRVNGSLSSDQLEWLDELGSRADRPVMVFGHHPVWDESVDVRSDDTFGLLPDDTEALIKVFARRSRLVGYFAGHTHRNHVTNVPDAPNQVFAEVASVKDFPGSWAEYRVFEGCILQIHRRISTKRALAWSERARGMFDGFYGDYAFGQLADRCFAIPLPR